MNSHLPRSRFLAAVGAVSVPLAIPRAASAADPAYTLRFGVTSAGSVVLGAIEFAKAVARRSNGQIKIDVYPSGQLASERDSIEGLVNGVIDFSATSNAFIEPLVPRVQIIDLPFLVRDLDTGYRLLDGAIGNELFAELETKGIVGLTWGTASFKQLETTTKAITVVDDMKGLRFRIQSSPLFVSTYQALGAIPVVLDVNETMTALAQKTVDGLDINLDAATSGKYYTVIKHVALSNHFFTVTPMLASKKKLDSLPVPFQKIIREEAKNTLPAWRQLFRKRGEESIGIMKANGVTFTEVQYPQFRKAVDPVYASFQPKLGADFIDRVTRIVNSRR